MKFKKLRHLVLISVMAFFTYACNLEYFDNAEFQDPVWNPTFAIPIGEIDYTVANLFQELNDPNAAVTTNSENIVTLLYVEELSAQDAESFVSIEDQLIGSRLNAGITSLNTPTARVISVRETFLFDLTVSGTQAFDSIFFDSGALEIDVTSDIKADVDFVLNIRSLRDKATSDIHVVTGSVNADTSPTFSSVDDLSTFKGVFTDDGLGGAVTNKILVELEYNINLVPGSDLDLSEGLEFDLSLLDQNFERLFGDIGQDELDLNSQTIDLDFFNTFEGGAIRFAEPKFTFTFDNSFGFPIGIDFQNIGAVSDGVTTPLTGSVTETVQIIEAPEVAQIGETIRSEVTLEVANSNIDELMSSKPSRMVFDVRAITNPDSGPDQYNFAQKDNFLDVDVEVAIPLHVGIEELTAEQSVNFGNGEDLDQVDGLMLRLIVENGIPMGGSVEMVFMNGNTPVYTITDRPLFEAAPVGTDGRVTSDTETIADVILDSDAVRAMESATRILVRATLSTTGATSGENVRLFSDYKMNIKLAMQADLSLTSSGN